MHPTEEMLDQYAMGRMEERREAIDRALSALGGVSATTARRSHIFNHLPKDVDMLHEIVVELNGKRPIPK
jgi:hypothetical protein